MTKSNTGDFVTGLQEAVRQNPVSAALVGVGLLWMFTGGSKLSTAAALLGPATRAVASGANAGMQHAGDAMVSVSSDIASAGEQLANNVQHSARDTVTAIGSAASNALDSVQQMASNTARNSNVAAHQAIVPVSAFGGALQENLKQTLNRQPLLLGAIGIAIGAGMAAAFPTSQAEQDAMGETAAGVMNKVQDTATIAAEQVATVASRTFEAVKQEASAQGLTVQNAKDGVAAVAAKVKTAAQNTARVE